jgi:protein phosphatase
MRFSLKRGSGHHTARRLVFAGETHVGLVREVNEDCFCYVDYPQDRNSLAVVADGIGGHQSGDIASAMCCRRFVASWKGQKAGQFRSIDKIKNFLNEEIISANEEIYKQNCRKQLPQPMGTTIVAAVFSPDKVVVGHAGDSRLYGFSNGRLKRMTEDHSFVAELVRKKVISEKEAETHPFSHVISKSVGPAAELIPEINVFERDPSARYMLCSDGLIIHIKEDRIADIFRNNTTPKTALNELMKEALIKGGEDNVTVVCAF